MSFTRETSKNELAQEVELRIIACELGLTKVSEPGELFYEWSNSLRVYARLVYGVSDPAFFKEVCDDLKGLEITPSRRFTDPAMRANQRSELFMLRERLVAITDKVLARGSKRSAGAVSGGAV